MSPNNQALPLAQNIPEQQSKTAEILKNILEKDGTMHAWYCSPSQGNWYWLLQRGFWCYLDA